MQESVRRVGSCMGAIVTIPYRDVGLSFGSDRSLARLSPHQDMKYDGNRYAEPTCV
jgi:hypothetical protein